MNIDFGNSGSVGPFLSWQARASTDGETPAKCFVLRTDEGKRVIDNFKRGVVLDIDALKLGWCRSDGTVGTAPQWKWNASVAKYDASPGDDWKKGFSLPVGLAPGELCVWEQSQAGAFSAIQSLFMEIARAQRAAGTLPVVQHVGENRIESKRGLTFSPILKVVKWVPRPAFMGGGAAPAFDPAPPAPPAPRPAPQPAPAMAGGGGGPLPDADLPFAAEWR